MERVAAALPVLTTERLVLRELTPEGDAIPIEKIQRELPPGTFLIEYSVLDDQTCVWIVSHHGHDLLTLPIRRTEIIV